MDKKSGLNYKERKLGQGAVFEKADIWKQGADEQKGRT